MSKVQIDSLSAEIRKELDTYKDITTEGIKKAVKEAGKIAKAEIEQTAPSNTGKYKKSWAVKTTRETANSLAVVVYSKNRYQLTHLLEFGHAKRNGGRVSARPHIANAENKAIQSFEKAIKETINDG